MQLAYDTDLDNPSNAGICARICLGEDKDGVLSNNLSNDAAWQNEEWIQKYFKQEGFEARNALTVPVVTVDHRTGHDGEPLIQAVLQCYNKRSLGVRADDFDLGGGEYTQSQDVRRHNDLATFTEQDLIEMRHLANDVGQAIKRLSVDLIFEEAR